ncbi:MAG TPA: TetR family transcriptional regulator [Solirubrobacteraceae bacterium]
MALRPSYAEATKTLLRERLLDAAEDLLRERAWTRISMADIARRAGVSRQTLYNEIGSRGDFAQAYVLREADIFLGAVEQAVMENLDDPHAALSDAFDVFLGVASQDPLIRAIVSGDGSDGLLALFTTHGAPVLRHATDRLAQILATGWPQVDIDGARPLADCVVRLAISHAALPAGSSAVTVARISEIIGPYLDALLATTGDGAGASV